MKTMSKLAASAFALSLAVASAVALTASPAAAATNSCKVLKGTSTFHPPIPVKGSVSGYITSTGTVSGCTGTKPTGGSGTFTSKIKSSKPGSCATLVKGGNVLQGTAKTSWKNGKVTNMKITVKTGTGTHYNIANITGTVSSGLFAGKHVTGQVKFTPKRKTDCISTPLQQVTFVNTKPFALV